MKLIAIEELAKRKYSVRVINALKRFWMTQQSFSCKHKPKKVDMLMYLDGFDAEYTLMDGEKLHAHDGDVVYIPKGSEYEVQMINRKTETSYTIGINLHLRDENKTPFILSENIMIFSEKDSIYSILFNKVDVYSEQAHMNYGMMKAGVYELIFRLGEQSRRKLSDKFGIISKGIQLIEKSEEDLPVSEIAALCHVSETYFYKLFKLYSGGISPMQYIMNSKIERAKIFLKYEEISVAEIAEILHFGSAAYFIRIFKKYTGQTPLEWRKTSI